VDSVVDSVVDLVAVDSEVGLEVEMVGSAAEGLEAPQPLFRTLMVV